MSYNLQRDLDLIPQFDTDTLYCLKNFYRDKVNHIRGAEIISNQDDLELISIIMNFVTNCMKEENVING